MRSQLAQWIVLMGGLAGCAGPGAALPPAARARPAGICEALGAMDGQIVGARRRIGVVQRGKINVPQTDGVTVLLRSGAGEVREIDLAVAAPAEADLLLAEVRSDEGKRCPPR